MSAERRDEPLELASSHPVEVIPGRSLHRKLAQIMYEAERIPKNGTAPQAMGGYKFVQVGDAADYIRKALAEQVITMMPTHVQIVGQVDRPTKSGGTMTTVDLLVDWTLTDGETGETIVIQSFGAGADGGDKYSGKASTSAMKYALLSGFLLSTGDDVEMSDTSDRQPPKPEPKVPAPGPANSGLISAQQDHSGETLRSLGPVERVGAVSRGQGHHTMLEWRQAPDGWTIGFLLEVGDNKPRPQVFVQGPLATALFTALDDGKRSIEGQKVTVAGEVFEVTAPQRRKLFRIVASRIETDDFILPAPVTDAPSEPIWGPTDMADLDAAVGAGTG